MLKKKKKGKEEGKAWLDTEELTPQVCWKRPRTQEWYLQVYEQSNTTTTTTKKKTLMHYLPEQMNTAHYDRCKQQQKNVHTAKPLHMYDITMMENRESPP